MLTSAQRRFNRLMAPRCIVCEQPFGSMCERAGEVYYCLEWGDACAECFHYLAPEETPKETLKKQHASAAIAINGMHVRVLANHLLPKA